MSSVTHCLFSVIGHSVKQNPYLLSRKLYLVDNILGYSVAKRTSLSVGPQEQGQQKERHTLEKTLNPPPPHTARIDKRSRKLFQWQKLFIEMNFNFKQI